jgi:hypothetical protein
LHGDAERQVVERRVRVSHLSPRRRHFVMDACNH